MTDDGRTVVYTDGACSGNPGPGGWAWAVRDGKRATGSESWTTNQRMELIAALEAVKANQGPLRIVSDSKYVVNCFRDRWWEGWLRRGWRNSQNKPVKNRELWEPLIELVRAGDVTFTWVKGHSGDQMNDLVDRLAVQAVPGGDKRSKSGRTGPHFADRVPRRSGTSPRRNSGRPVDPYRRNNARVKQRLDRRVSVEGNGVGAEAHLIVSKTRRRLDQGNDR